MKRACLITVLLTLPVILIVALLIIQDSRPTAWQVELDRYKAYKEASISIGLITKQVDRGTMPWHFNSVMSAAAYGENPYFGTDYGYDGQRHEGGSRSIPYPPEAVWCALLEADPNSPSPVIGEPVYVVAFVAEHQDMYNAAFVVHEAASARIPLVEILSLVGCHNVREEIQFSEASRWT
jgi:hypothetical protein